ncbi:MAG: hypothetical protein HY319_27470 [Armatimonadetes bacterium]|nr:hypothetical protein [Armatimonadota bacterium]
MAGPHIQELFTEAPGRLFTHYGFETGSPGVRRRRIFVYLPEAYLDMRRKRFPVLYLLDGQNVMDLESSRYGGWKTNVAAERLAQEGRITPPVVVGIAASSQRLREYMGWSQEPNHRHVAGEKHCAYVLEQVVPFIESQYRISNRRRSRIVGGASAGGVAALHMAFSYPTVFGGVGVLSAGRHFFPELARRFLAGEPPDLRIFLSCGTRGMDSELYPQTRAFCGRLKAARMEYRYVHRRRGAHNERSWASVMPEMLEYFFSVE